MKRWLVLILSVSIWVSGCAAKAPAQPVTHSFCCTLSVTGGTEPFAGRLTVTEADLTWALTSPQTVAGSLLFCDGDTLTLTPPDGEPLVVEAGDLPPDGVLPVLWNVLRTADPAAVSRQEPDGKLTGRVTGGSYLLLTDAVTGNPKSLRLDGGDWIAVFSGVERLAK